MGQQALGRAGYWRQVVLLLQEKMAVVGDWLLRLLRDATAPFLPCPARNAFHQRLRPP